MRNLLKQKIKRMKKIFIFSLLLFIGHTIYAQQETDNQIKLLMEQNANLKKRLENLETQMDDIHKNDPENKRESTFNNEVEPLELKLGSVKAVPDIQYHSIYGDDDDDNDKEPSLFDSPPPTNTFTIRENMGKIKNTPTYGTGQVRNADDLSELSDYDVLTGNSQYGSGKDDYMYRHQSTMSLMDQYIEELGMSDPNKEKTAIQQLAAGASGTQDISGTPLPDDSAKLRDDAQGTWEMLGKETNDSISAIVLGVFVCVLLISSFFMYKKGA